MDIAVLAGTSDPDRGCEICRLLASQALREGFVCESCEVVDVVARAALMRPDVVLTELAEGQDAEFLLRQLRRVSPRSRVLLVVGIATQDLVVAAIRGGAGGILAHAADPQTLGQAVRAVAAGEAWFDHQLLHRTLLGLLRAPAARATQGTIHGGADLHLTPREEEILGLIGDGLSNKEIAKRLAISDTTVKTHLHRVYVKLNRSGRYKAFRAKPKAPLPSAWGTLV